MSAPEKIFNFTKPPIMLIGAGISKRYMEGYLDWTELLRSVAERIGVPNKTFIAYLADAKNSNGKTDLAEVASELRKKLIEDIKNESIDPDELFDEEEKKLYYAAVDPIKILVSSLCQLNKIRDGEKTSIELESFKKLDKVVPCVVTTNYDLFLERSIFSTFKVYSNVSDYYYSDSEGIGEIFKIHGTVSKPSTMVVTQEDYEELRKKSKLVTAKILSALCDYPLVILGYSMDDEDVKEIINDLIYSLSEDKLQEVEKNIIYVEYVEDEDGFRKKNRVFPFENKTMTISTIGTDNFKMIFDELSNMTPTMSPLAIRKARQMVKEIVLSEDGANGVSLIGVDRIDDISTDKLVIAFADRDTIQRMKSNLNFYSNNQMIEDILNDKFRYSPEDVVNFFDRDKNRLSSNEYFPVFHFARLTGIKKEDFSPKLKSFYETKKWQFDQNLKRIGNLNLVKSANIVNIADLQRLMGSFGDFYRSDIIFYYYGEGVINEEEAKMLLKKLWATKIRDGEFTSFRRAITYLAFKYYEK